MKNNNNIHSRNPCTYERIAASLHAFHFCVLLLIQKLGYRSTFLMRFKFFLNHYLIDFILWTSVRGVSFYLVINFGWNNSDFSVCTIFFYYTKCFFHLIFFYFFIILMFHLICIQSSSCCWLIIFIYVSLIYLYIYCYIADMNKVIHDTIAILISNISSLYQCLFKTERFYYEILRCLHFWSMPYKCVWLWHT